MRIGAPGELLHHVSTQPRCYPAVHAAALEEQRVAIQICSDAKALSCTKSRGRDKHTRTRGAETSTRKDPETCGGDVYRCDDCEYDINDEDHVEAVG